MTKEPQLVVPLEKAFSDEARAAAAEARRSGAKAGTTGKTGAKNSEKMDKKVEETKTQVEHAGGRVTGVQDRTSPATGGKERVLSVEHPEGNHTVSINHNGPKDFQVHIWSGKGEEDEDGNVYHAHLGTHSTYEGAHQEAKARGGLGR